MGNSEVKISNGIFLKNELKLIENYKQKVESLFNAKLLNLDLTRKAEAAKIINNWVDEATNHKITSMVNEGMVYIFNRLKLIM